MLTFPVTFPRPNIPTTSGCGNSCKLSIKDSTITTETDANYKLTRPRTTRMLRTWTFAWKAVPAEDMQRLLDFFAKVGTFNSFEMRNWLDGKVHEVRFAEPLQDWQGNYPVGWQGSLKFEEV